MTLKDSVTELKGVGGELGKKFAVLGINSIGDLVDYFPKRYEDFSTITPIVQIKPGGVSIQAVIKQVRGRYVRRGLHITEAIASDSTSSVRLVWFNQPYRASSIKTNVPYFLSGQFELSRQRLSIMNPSVELVSDFQVNTARILPVYRETKGLNSKQIRKVVREVIYLVRTLDENLPQWVIKQNDLISRVDAVESIHFPKDLSDLHKAQRRLGFEEVFTLSLASLLNKYEISHKSSMRVKFDLKTAKDFVSNLPFKLTDSQKRIVWQIYQDMEKPHPMNRLIEGEVGSGKTVVGAMAALMVMNQKQQAAFMAPTELLATQHAQTIFELLSPLGLDRQVGFLTGSMSEDQKKVARQRIKSGDIRLIIGTHALIQEKVDMNKLNLIIIDEQHRFGVEQRKTLMKKAGHMPHVLSLTATPIPRSLALTLYGELDVSILAELPPGRIPVTTKIISPNSIDKMYEKMKEEIKAGHQVFVVCPNISEGIEKGTPSVEKVYDDLRTKTFKEYRVGLIHGKLKSSEKAAAMQKFIDKKTDILVATTVIEVGVDVPNATVMVVESADRFGLAQLHQLRGRVGRGSVPSHCYLVTSDSSPPSPRLRAMVSSSDGIKLAELDLEIRGPGAIYGTLQHGALDLRIAKLSDIKLITSARKSAQEFIDKKEDLRHNKELFDKVALLRAVTNLN